MTGSLRTLFFCHHQRRLAHVGMGLDRIDRLAHQAAHRCPGRQVGGHGAHGDVAVGHHPPHAPVFPADGQRSHAVMGQQPRRAFNGIVRRQGNDARLMISETNIKRPSFHTN